MNDTRITKTREIETFDFKPFDLGKPFQIITRSGNGFIYQYGILIRYEARWVTFTMHNPLTSIPEKMSYDKHFVIADVVNGNVQLNRIIFEEEE